MPVHKRKTVFISGSAYEYGIFGDDGKAFIRHLTRALLRNGFTIISGFGLGVGNYVVEEALKVLYRENTAELADHLQVFPFPGSRQEENVRRHYRNYMLSRADIVIFIFGNKLEDIAIKDADGVLEEFGIARARQSLLIPVGASGYVSGKIWKDVMEQYDYYFDNRDHYELFRQLGRHDLHPLELIETIIQIALQNEKESICQF